MEPTQGVLPLAECMPPSSPSNTPNSHSSSTALLLPTPHRNRHLTPRAIPPLVPRSPRTLIASVVRNKDSREKLLGGMATSHLPYGLSMFLPMVLSKTGSMSASAPYQQQPSQVPQAYASAPGESSQVPILPQSQSRIRSTDGYEVCSSIRVVSEERLFVISSQIVD